MPESDAGKKSESPERVSMRTRTLLLWTAAFATLILGFADLARGGTTIAPILLVVGYCILVPVAILK